MSLLIAMIVLAAWMCAFIAVGRGTRQDGRMNDSAQEPASSWLTQRVEWLSRLSASYPFAIDLAICLATAALSIVELATQHRLDTPAVIFCGALCASLLLRRNPWWLPAVAGSTVCASVPPATEGSSKPAPDRGAAGACTCD
jgi:hypothetical protein